MFYLKLAKENLKRDKKTYVPYLLISIFIIVIFYEMTALFFNKEVLGIGGYSLWAILNFSVFVTGIFACIFFLYLDSLLMQKRKTELGLYNILGLNKYHIMKLVLIEKLILSGITIITGIVIGILFNKVIFLFLLKLIRHGKIPTFSVAIESIITTGVLFVGINIVLIIKDMISIKRSSIINLLKSKNVGEKEPKGKIIIGIIGAVFLGAGYYKGYTVETGATALNSFFIAVIFVMIGIYFIFTSGSIVLLNFFRKRKSIYYKTNNFISIGTMIYRMKKNAIGLANICILSTAVILALSTSVTLYLTSQKRFNEMYPQDINLRVMDGNIQSVEKTNSIISKNKINSVNELVYKAGLFNINGENFSDSNNGVLSDVSIVYIPLSMYNKDLKQNIKLKENEALLYSKQIDYKYSKIKFKDKTYNIQKIDTLGKLKNEDEAVIDSMILVVNDNEFKTDLFYIASFDLDNRGDIVSDARKLGEELKEAKIKSFHINDKVSAKIEFDSLYGGFLFIGIFISLVFFLGTILIIYYKQISEGIDDKERYKIMEKIGLSDNETKKIIRCQLRIIFMIPCIFAIINSFFAYPMVQKILDLLSLGSIGGFKETIVCVLIGYSILYIIIYRITSKVYYKIIK